jgi:hypothetical protein
MTTTINASNSGSGGLVQTADASGVLALQTAGVTAVTISTAQAVTFAGTATFPTTLGVGGATPSTSGAGISFPATQSPSSDVNTLDDYEEGTWTPVVNGQNQASCLYNKIGRLVTLAGDITLSFTGGVQNTMGGLPFGVNSASQYGNVLPYQQNTAGPLSILVTTAATFNFYNGQSGQINISTGSRLIFTISYLCSQ